MKSQKYSIHKTSDSMEDSSFSDISMYSRNVYAEYLSGISNEQIDYNTITENFDFVNKWIGELFSKNIEGFNAFFDSTYNSIKNGVVFENIKNKKEADCMDSNQILEKYIDKVDRDQVALRADIRESERRIFSQIKSSEDRMDLRLNRIEDMISHVNDKMDSVRDHSNDSLKWNIGVAIATIIGIATLVYTAIAN